MKLLGIFYTHNKTKPVLMQQVVKHILQAADYSNLNNGVKGNTTVELVAVPWEPIPGWNREQHISFLKGGAPGHLNIATQILRALYTKKDEGFDLAVQLEHDVLYAPNYFERIAQTWLQATMTKKDPAEGFVQERWVKIWNGQTELVGISSLDYIGMNETGYLRVRERHEPLSMISMTIPYAIANYERCLQECIMTGWCYLEPQDKRGLAHIPFLDKTPNVHVNMNHQPGHNHHFTNHYDVCYRADSGGVTERELWGDFKQYGIFD